MSTNRLGEASVMRTGLGKADFDRTELANGQVRL